MTKAEKMKLKYAQAQAGEPINRNLSAMDVHNAYNGTPEMIQNEHVSIKMESPNRK
jgi:hypothetical protein